MDNINGSTLWLIKLLTETRSGYDWALRFFWNIHKDVSTGKYDEAACMQRFREVVEKNFQDKIMSKEGGFLLVKSDEIDWYQLYMKCFEMTKP